MKVTKKLFWIAGVALLCTLGLFWAKNWLTPKSILGSLQLSLGGITNAQSAVFFTVTNSSRWQITYWPRIEVKENGMWPQYPLNVPNSDFGKEFMLSPHETAGFYILPPTNVAQWRVWVSYTAATERNETVLDIWRLLDRVGLASVHDWIPLDLGGWAVFPESKEPFNRQSH